MEYYHVVMETRTEGKRIHLVSLDRTEEEVRHFAESLTKKDKFPLEGENIPPSQVHRVSLFRTAKPTAELVLPNGKSIADYKSSECKPVGCCKHRYIAACFTKGKVKEASDCAKEFISSRTSGNRTKST